MKAVQAGTQTSKEALEPYESDMIHRGATEIEASTKVMYAVHDFEGLMASPILKTSSRKATELQVK
jgi:hypothetical protein